MSESRPQRTIPLYHRLSVKVALGTLFLGILPLIGLAWYVAHRFDQISREILFRQNLLFAQQCKNEVSRFLESAQHFLLLLKDDDRLAGLASDSHAGTFRRHIQRRESFEWLRFVNRSGIPRVHVGQTPTSSGDSNGFEADFLASPRDILFRQGGAVIKCPAQLASEPGYLLAGLSLNRVQESLSKLNLGSDLLFFFVDLDGKWVLGQGLFRQDLFKDLLIHPFGSFELSGSDNSFPESVAVTLPVPSLGLRIVVLQEASSEALGLSRRHGLIAAIVFGLLLLATLLVFSVTSRITSVLMVISRTTDQIAEGNMKAKVQIDRQDEIGLLAANFNRMASRIRNKIFELNALFKVSEIINQALTHQKAMDQSLAYIVTIFLARRGSILLLSDNQEILRLKSVKNFGAIEDGPPETFTEHINLKPGEGIAGLALQTGKPVFSENCRTDARFKPYPEDSGIEPPASLLSVPLIAQGRTFGVLNLADRSDHKHFRNLSEDDIDLIMTVANQTAISIDNARLQELAITDGLTKLFIHRYFQIKLDEEIKRSRRYGDLFALVLFDIDHFKKFNDTYGHQQGDSVLRETGALLIQSLRVTDLGFRYGGEEFALILPKTSAEQALIIAERLRHKISQHPFPGSEGPLHVTISIGIAEFPGAAVEKTLLIKNADVALYCSKEHGRDRTTIHSPGMEIGRKG